MTTDEFHKLIFHEFGVSLANIRAKKPLKKWYSEEYDKISEIVYCPNHERTRTFLESSSYIKDMLWEMLLENKDLIKFYLL